MYHNNTHRQPMSVWKERYQPTDVINKLQDIQRDFHNTKTIDGGMLRLISLLNDKNVHEYLPTNNTYMRVFLFNMFTLLSKNIRKGMASLNLGRDVFNAAIARQGYLSEKQRDRVLGFLQVVDGISSGKVALESPHSSPSPLSSPSSSPRSPHSSTPTRTDDLFLSRHDPYDRKRKRMDDYKHEEYDKHNGREKSRHYDAHYDYNRSVVIDDTNRNYPSEEEKKVEEKTQPEKIGDEENPSTEMILHEVVKSVTQVKSIMVYTQEMCSKTVDKLATLQTQVSILQDHQDNLIKDLADVTARQTHFGNVYKQLDSRVVEIEEMIKYMKRIEDKQQALEVQYRDNKGLEATVHDLSKQVKRLSDEVRDMREDRHKRFDNKYTSPPNHNNSNSYYHSSSQSRSTYGSRSDYNSSRRSSDDKSGSIRHEHEEVKRKQDPVVEPMEKKHVVVNNNTPVDLTASSDTNEQPAKDSFISVQPPGFINFL